MDKYPQRHCDLRKDGKKISIYLTESESREKFFDYQVRVYGDGYTNNDLRFKFENFSTRNTEKSYTQANEYFNERKEHFLNLGFVEKIGLIDKIKAKMKM